MNILNDFKDLDPNNPGLWPVSVKAILFIVIFAALLFAGWKFDITKQRDELAGLERQEQEKIEVLKLKQRKAANLNALKEQMQEREISFGDMVRQLPNATEVAGLLVDISQTGLSAGLEFKLFEPQPEEPKEFYAVLPIKIKVHGDYHKFGEFISGLARLPRIVTTHNVDLKVNPLFKSSGTAYSELEMEMIAQTYRALDEEEEEEQ